MHTYHKKKERNLVNNNNPQTKKKTTFCANATKLNAKHCVLTAGFQHKLFFAFQLSIKKKSWTEILVLCQPSITGFPQLKMKLLIFEFLCVCAFTFIKMSTKQQQKQNSFHTQL